MIGVFDSGLGGLVVVREIWKLNPGLAITYIGDTAHVPYGELAVEQIRQLAKESVGKLRSIGVDKIICACNTSWAVVGKELDVEWSVTEFGKWAAAGKIAGVLATTRTIESGIYGLPGQAVPGLVPLIEKGTWEGPEVEQVLEDPIERLGNVEAVILGCTHFPLVRSTIEKMMPGVKIIDPGKELAKEVVGETGESKFYLTRLNPDYETLTRKILGKWVEFELV